MAFPYPHRAHEAAYHRMESQRWLDLCLPELDGQWDSYSSPMQNAQDHHHTADHIVCEVLDLAPTYRSWIYNNPRSKMSAPDNSIRYAPKVLFGSTQAIEHVGHALELNQRMLDLIEAGYDVHVYFTRRVASGADYDLVKTVIPAENIHHTSRYVIDSGEPYSPPGKKDPALFTMFKAIAKNFGVDYHGELGPDHDFTTVRWAIKNAGVITRTY